MTTTAGSGSIDVTVKVFGGLRGLVGNADITLTVPAEGATVAAVLAALGERVPTLQPKLAEGLDRGYLNLLLDGRNVRFLEGPDTPVGDGATIALVPPIGGG